MVPTPEIPNQMSGVEAQQSVFLEALQVIPMHSQFENRCHRKIGDALAPFNMVFSFLQIKKLRGRMVDLLEFFKLTNSKAKTKVRVSWLLVPLPLSEVFTCKAFQILTVNA